MNPDTGVVVLQGVTLPVGLCVLEGPFGGPEADATMQVRSNLEDDLDILSTEIRAQDPNAALLCVYGDSAYRATLHVIPATRYTLASPAQKTLNNVMKPMRVIVEQNFACVSQVAGIVRVQLSLGSGPIGKVYPVATLLTNVYTLLYGNTITCSVPGGMDVLQKISVEEYLTI